MKRTAALLMTLAALTTFAAVAGAHTPAFRNRNGDFSRWNRSDRLALRIQEGIRSGALTRGEVARLRAGLMQIRQLTRIARADGVVDARERAMIQRARQREIQLLWRLTHNARVA